MDSHANEYIKSTQLCACINAFMNMHASFTHIHTHTLIWQKCTHTDTHTSKLHICQHTHIHQVIYTHAKAWFGTHAYTCAYTCTHALVHTCTRAHSYTHACTDMLLLTRMHQHIHLHINAFKDTHYAHICIRAQGIYTRAHTHKHASSHVI